MKRKYILSNKSYKKEIVKQAYTTTKVLTENYNFERDISFDFCRYHGRLFLF